MIQGSSPERQPSVTSCPGVRVLAWYRRAFPYGIAGLGILFFVVFGFVFLRGGQPSGWEDVFVRAARRLQAAEPIYRPGGNFPYPPIVAMLSAPLANLPPWPSLLGWYLVNVAASVVAFVCAWRQAGGPPLGNLDGRWQAVLLIGVILAGRFFVAPLENRSFDMVIAALLLVGCYQLAKGHDLMGATWLGVSTAMKGTPLLFAPYLIWRGKARAAGVLVAVAVILNLLPDLVWPQTGGRLYLADWYAHSLAWLPRSTPGEWYSDVLLNQSLSGLFNRFTRFGLPLSSMQLEVKRVALTEGRLLALKGLIYGTGFLLVVITAWRFGLPGTAAPPQNPAPPGPVPLEGLRTPMESAAILCLMLLLSPMSSKSHFVVLLLPSFILGRLIIEQRSFFLKGLLIALLITGPLTAKGLIGKELGALTLAWGFPTWFIGFSLLGIWWALGTVRRREVSSITAQRAGAQA